MDFKKYQHVERFGTMEVEESWNFIKKYKNPMINFKRLQGMVTAKIKEVKPELF